MKKSIQLIIQDIKAARWAIVLVIAYFAFLRSVLISLCPMVWFTGFPCPACGMTRAAFRVLHLDFLGAWSTHPFIYPVILIAVVFCIYRYILHGTKYEWLKWTLIVLIAGMILFYIYRMIRFFPGASPMSYYPGNMIARFASALKLW